MVFTSKSGIHQPSILKEMNVLFDFSMRAIEHRLRRHVSPAGVCSTPNRMARNKSMSRCMPEL
jgi:hypothetical protein